MGDPSNLVAQGNTYRVLYLGNDEGFIKKLAQPSSQTDPAHLEFSCESNIFKVYHHMEGGRLSLILLDLVSDVRSGGLDRIAALSEMMPEIPIVALIQRDDADMMGDIFLKGAQDCLIREEFDWTMLMYLAHNIIRRWRAQATLRSRKDELTGLRQEYQALLRSTPNGLCMVNPDWSIRWANRAMTRFFDPEARHTQELVGNSLQMFFESQADFEQYCALARRAVRTLGIDVREWKLRRLDGSPAFAQLSIVRLDPSQTDPGYTVTLTDVTESRRANEQLRQTKEALQTIYDGMVDGLVIADSENRHILHVNAALCGLLGYTEAELCKMRIENLHPPEEIPRVLKMYEKILQGKVDSLHGLVCLHKDGSIHHVDIVARLIRYDDKICVIGFLRDAKERMMADERLRFSEMRLRLMVEQIPAILWTTNQELALQSLQGLGLGVLAPHDADSQSRFYGKPLKDFLLTMKSPLQTLQASQDALQGASRTLESKWGERSYQIHVEPLRDAEGHIIGTVGLALVIMESPPKAVKNSPARQKRPPSPSR